MFKHFKCGAFGLMSSNMITATNRPMMSHINNDTQAYDVTH
jgi:hypothetical protein